MHGYVLDATSYSSDPQSVGMARRRAVRVYGDHPDVDEDLLFRIEVIISEGVANAVGHGSGVVQVICHAPLDGQLQIEVHDQGRRIPVRKPGALEDENGRGLALAEGLGARWSVNRTYTGKSVSFTLEVKSCSRIAA
jgi:anti-sigma regulatory factor (Ser/Thr protein kinase)